MKSQCLFSFFLQAEDGIRDLVRSRGLGDVYKRQGDMHRIKDELEQAASATEPRPATLAGVHETLERVAAALREGGLRSSADTLDKQLQKIGAALGGGTELQRQLSFIHI